MPTDLRMGVERLFLREPRADNDRRANERTEDERRG